MWVKEAINSPLVFFCFVLFFFLQKNEKQMGRGGGVEQDSKFQRRRYRGFRLHVIRTSQPQATSRLTCRHGKRDPAKPARRMGLRRLAFSVPTIREFKINDCSDDAPKFAYLIDKNKSFARPSRAFFNSVHFFQVLGKSAMWNDHFSSVTENVNTQAQIWIQYSFLALTPDL